MKMMVMLVEMMMDVVLCCEFGIVLCDVTVMCVKIQTNFIFLYTIVWGDLKGHATR